MRLMRLSILTLGCLLSASCAAPPNGFRSTGLANRVAGAAQRCVSVQPSETIRISGSDPHTLSFGSGQTIWANRLQSQCSFRSSDVIVTKPLGSYYCRGDVVTSFDNVSRNPGATCILGDFLPYTHSPRSTY